MKPKKILMPEEVVKDTASQRKEAERSLALRGMVVVKWISRSGFSYPIVIKNQTP